MRIFRRRRSRRKFRLTREGRAFLFVTVGVGLAAVNTANNLLYLVLGLLLSLLLVSGVLSDLALWKLEISRSVPTRLFAGRRSYMDVALLNAKRWLVERLRRTHRRARWRRNGAGEVRSRRVRRDPTRELQLQHAATWHGHAWHHAGDDTLPLRTHREGLHDLSSRRDLGLSAAPRARGDARPTPDTRRRSSNSPDRPGQRVRRERPLLP